MKKFLEYSEYLTTPENEILHQLRRETYLKVLMPRMLSGHLQGKLLELISILKQPEKILEIGTFTGYSTICLAKGLSQNGKIITIERNDELEPIITKYFKLANIYDKVEIIFDDALKVLPAIKDSFDIVFIDADKRFYQQFYEMVFPKVKSGGLILVDNIFWNGKVFEQVPEKDKYTKGVLEFNERIRQDKRVEILTLPVRDGLMIIRKL